MSIERYICDSDPYRSTTLPMPLPFPLAMGNSPELELRLRFLQPQIEQTLRDDGLSSEAHVIPYVMNNPFYPGFGTPQNMLCVILQGNEQVSHEFDPTKDGLLTLLQSHNINNVHVEIRDVDLNSSASLFAIPPNHPIVTIYENVKHDIIGVLRQKIPSQWRLSSVFRVGQTEEIATPSFVVLVDPMTSANWSQ